MSDAPAARVQCPACGEALNAASARCPQCATPQQALCACGAAVSIHEQRCACGRPVDVPAASRTRWLRVAVLVALLAAASGWIGWSAYGPGGTREPADDLFAAHTALEENRLADALPWFERYLRAKPRDAANRAVYGAALIQSGALADGRSELEAALDQDPGLPIAGAWLSRVLLAEGELERAAELAEVALGSPGTRGKGRLVLGLAEALEPAGDPVRAVDHLRAAHDAGDTSGADLVVLLEQASRIHPTHPHAPTRTELEEWYRAAVDGLRDDVSVDRGNPTELALLLSRAHAAMGDFFDARQVLHDTPRRDARVLLQSAHLALAAGDSDAAKEALETLDPPRLDGATLRRAVDLWGGADEPATAIALVESFEAAHGPSRESRLARFHALRRARRGDAALAVLREAREAHPDDPEVLLTLADVLRSRPESRDEAIALLRARVSKPDADRARLRLADTLIDEFELRGDSKLLEEARSLAGELPHSAAKRVVDGRIAALDGDLEEARSTLEHADLARHAEPVVSRLLARVHRARGDAAAETRALTDLIERTSERAETRIARADAALRAGWIDMAREDATRAIELRPEDASARLILAAADARTPTRRERALQSARELLDHDDPAVAVHAAELLARLEDSARGTVASEPALAAWRAVIAAHPQALAPRRQLAALLAGVGRIDDTEVEVEALLALAPTDVEARRIHLDALWTPEFPHFERPDDAMRLIDEIERLATDSPAAHYARGARALAEGSDKDAAAAFERVLEARPGHALTWMALGMAEERLGNTRRAVDAFRRATSLDARLAAPARRAVLLGIRRAGEQLAAGEADAALESAEGVVTATHNERWARGYRVLTAFASALRGRPELLAQARADAEQLLAESRGTPKEVLAIGFAGDVARVQGDREAEVAYRRELVTVAPESARAHQALALALRESRATEQALAHARRAHELDEADPEATALLLALLIDSGAEEEALRRATDATRAAPDSTVAWLQLARMRERVGNPRGAFDAYRRAARLDPDSVVALRGLARSLIAAGEPAGADDELDALAPSSSRKGLILFLRSDARLALGDEEGAAELLQDALEAGIDDAFTRAVATVRTLRAARASGNFAGGIRVANDLLSWEPRIPTLDAESPLALALADAAGEAGLLRMATHDQELAEVAFRRALRRTPNAAHLVNNLACALVEQADPDAASVSSRCVELAPGNASYWDTHGSALLLTGRVDAALRAFDRAVKLYDGAPEHQDAGAVARTLVRRADARLLDGDHEEAATDLENARRHDPTIVRYEPYRRCAHELERPR